MTYTLTIRSAYDGSIETRTINDTVGSTYDYDSVEEKAIDCARSWVEDGDTVTIEGPNGYRKVMRPEQPMNRIRGGGRYRHA